MGPEAIIALQAAGTVMSVMGAMQQGRATATAADYNAQVARQRAQIAAQQSRQDAEAQQRTTTRRLGAMRASYGVAGVTAEGSVLDVLASSAAEGELDRQTILYKGKLKELGFQNEVTSETYRADSALQGGYMKSATALLTGGATTGDWLYWYNKGKRSGPSIEGAIDEIDPIYA